MRFRAALVVAAGLLALSFVTSAPAQQSGMGSQMPQSPQTPGQSPTQGGMCPMCSSGMCPMMGGMQGGMMGGGMMGMGGQADSPKAVQMRGEMMKAMGEVMIKYGKMMEGSGGGR